MHYLPPLFALVIYIKPDNLTIQKKTSFSELSQVNILIQHL